jgi:hypothetical protein
VKKWVDDVGPRTFIRTYDVPGSRGAVDSMLSRLAIQDGPLVRVRNGVYWKKPPATRFGTGGPDPVEAALVVAGKGAGPSGALAANALGLSTQVPARPVVAVLGRVPKGLGGVSFTTRSNLARRDLTPTDVAVLEVLREFPRYCDVDWAAAVRRLRVLDRDGVIDLDAVAAAARTEHRAGVADRVGDLVGT